MTNSHSNSIDIGREQIGKVYATALLRACAVNIDAVLEELGSLVDDVFERVPKLETTLASPRLSIDEKLGIEVEASPTIKLRAGIWFNDNPIPANEGMFSEMAASVQEQHYTAGLTWQASPSSALVVGLMYSPSNTLNGTAPGFLGGGNVDLEMYQWEATAGWTWTF